MDLNCFGCIMLLPHVPGCNHLLRCVSHRLEEEGRDPNLVDMLKYIFNLTQRQPKRVATEVMVSLGMRYRVCTPKQ